MVHDLGCWNSKTEKKEKTSAYFLDKYISLSLWSILLIDLVTQNLEGDFFMKTGKLKQILLITDGCSNVGGDPVAIASMAPEYGITINVIGILDDESLGERGIQEVKDIASAGTGIHQVVHSTVLPKTVQMVTRKAMTQTLQQVVNKELKHILGNAEQVDSLPPDKRGKVVEVVEDLGERVAVDVLILVDTSGSMKSKLPAVKHALRDLSISMQSRMGENQFSLWTFPGRQQAAEKKMEWSTQFLSLEKVFSSIIPQGTTPTGPALEEALHYFTGKSQPIDEEEGILSDYVL
jgi:Ca-activated chloride channel family protein